MWGAICSGWFYPCYLTYFGFYGLLGILRSNRDFTDFTIAFFLIHSAFASKFCFYSFFFCSVYRGDV